MALILTSCVIFSSILIHNNQTECENHLAQQTKNVRELTGLMVNRDRQHYLSHFTNLLNNPSNPASMEIIHAFASGDREKLLSKSLKLYEVLQSENPYFSTLGWILPDNKVFLRTHDPERDDQHTVKYRKDIREANNTLQPNSGFDFCQYGLKFRLALPVSLDNRHIGVITIGIDETQLTKMIHDHLNIPSFLYIPSSIFQPIENTHNIFNQPDTHTHLHQGGVVTSPNIPDLNDMLTQVNLGLEPQEITHSGKNYFIIKAMELKSFDGEVHGVIYTAIDISAQKATTRRLLVTIILTTLIILPLSFIILFFSYDKLTREITSLNAALTDTNLHLEDQIRVRTAKIKEEFNARRDSEKSLRIAKEQWENTFDAIQDVITIQDSEMRIVRANTAAEKLFKRPQDKLVGLKCHEILHQLKAPCPDCPIPTTIADNSPHHAVIHYDCLNKTFDVTSAPIFDENEEVQHIVHVATDITQQVLNEKSLTRLATAIEQASETIVITSTTGLIEYVNPAFELSTGYCRAEALGQNVSILKSGKQNNLFYKQMWEQIASGHIWNGQLTNRKKDGTLYKEEMTISPVLDKSGSITNFVAVKRDVTREIALEKQLNHAMKMEAIGTLAGGIAHDFNNILSVILGYGNMILAGLTPESPLRDDIKQILQAGNRATDLVRQILTFSHQGEGTFQPTHIQEVLSETVTFLRSSLPATIEITTEIDQGCPSIMANPSQIHQVVMNLCTNAKQAMEGHAGTLSIQLQTMEIKEEGQVAACPTLPTGSYLLLSVDDTGSGMDQAQIERIFDPFYTTKEKEKGTGLGLAVVHGIIKKHRGEISVTSEPGLGTSFNIYLPTSGEAMPEYNHEVKDSELGGTEKVLLVDDEQPVLDIEQKILSSLGYQVTSCSSPIEAIKLFQKAPESWDLIITDMTMPILTGSALAQQLLKIRPDIPIILCTGYSENIDEQKAHQLGIKGYLTKPIEQQKLAGMLRDLLEPGR